MPKNKDDLYNLIKNEAMHDDRVYSLKDGRKSGLHFDARKIFCHPRGMDWATERMARLVKPGTAYIGGVATGGMIPMSHITRFLWLKEIVAQGKSSVRGFYVRSEAKEHGLNTNLAEAYKSLEGYVPPPGSEVCMVEDVITTGSSVLHAVTVLARLDVTVTQVVALIDREAGAAEALAARGVELRKVFSVFQF